MQLLEKFEGFVKQILFVYSRHRETKMIIMSNSKGPAIEKLFKQSGANDMLEKPFQLKDVLDIIKLEVKETVDGD